MLDIVMALGIFNGVLEDIIIGSMRVADFERLYFLGRGIDIIDCPIVLLPAVSHGTKRVWLLPFRIGEKAYLPSFLTYCCADFLL